LQGLLVGLPFYVFHLPEAPYLLLNILSLGSLCLLGWYCTKRTPEVPQWFIWTWLLTAPWALNYSTQILNVSYVLTGAILFFIGVMESCPFLTKKVIPLGWANFMMGFSLFWMFQLHMSWPILVPFILASAYFQFKDRGKRFFVSSVYFFSGALLSASLVLPTFAKFGLKSGLGGTGANIQLNFSNLLKFLSILARFLSFASFELSRFVGGSTQVRLDFFKNNLWITPFALLLTVVGILQPVAMLVLWFSKKQPQEDWKRIKYLTLFTLLIVYVGFAFSIKEPASHTFYVVFPIAMIYSFYCWSRFLKKHVWRKFAVVFIVCGIIFHFGLALSRRPGKSLYKERSLPKMAIEKKDYRILGDRPPGSRY